MRTLGPWELVTGGGPGGDEYVYEIWPEDRTNVREPIVETDCGCYGPRVDDAKLIASSPELLQVVFNLVATRQGENCCEYKFSRKEVEIHAETVLKKWGLK